MKNILLIDDDPFLVRVYRSLMDEAGYQTFFLENGERAVETAIEVKPDLIVLDLIMPVKDGYDTLKALKGNESTRNIPVVVLTVIQAEEEIKKVTELGADEFIVKSNSSFKDVVNKIKEILK